MHFFSIPSKPEAIFCIIRDYGEFGSWDFFATVELLKIFVLVAPGSIMITFIPNGSSSYAIDSLRPSTANFVLS